MADSKTVDQEEPLKDPYADYDAAISKIKDPLLSAPPTIAVMHARFGAAPSTFGDPTPADIAAAQEAVANANTEQSTAFRERLRDFFKRRR